MSTPKYWGSPSTGIYGMSELTSKQREILEFVVWYREEHGRPPSGPEIADRFGYSDPHTAYEHLRRIEKKGFLEVNQPSKRAVLNIKPTEKTRRLLLSGLPVLGAIPAGPVSEAGTEVQASTIESLGDLLPMMKRDDYLLDVDGNSMEDVGIEEGTTALMRPDEEPSPGDICAVWVDGEGGTLKRVFPQGETIRLVPENDEYEPAEVDADRVRIQGVLVATVDISTFQDF